MHGAGFRVALTSFRYRKHSKSNADRSRLCRLLANYTHRCDPDDDEFLCHNGECISRSLRCDGKESPLMMSSTLSLNLGVAHCLDGSDESAHASCPSHVIETATTVNVAPAKYAFLSKSQHWRGILIVAFFLLIFAVFIFFMIYFLCRRCCTSERTSVSHTRKHYSTIVNSRRLLECVERGGDTMCAFSGGESEDTDDHACSDTKQQAPSGELQSAVN